MSLLNPVLSEKSRILAKKIYDEQFSTDNRLLSEYDERRRRLMMEDIMYNLDFLDSAVKYKTPVMFSGYAVWLYRLLAARMPDIGTERVKKHMTDHLSILLKNVTNEYTSEYSIKVKVCIEMALEAIENIKTEEYSAGEPGKHPDLLSAYLVALLSGNRNGAFKVISDAHDSGLPLSEIYIEILQRAMYEIGELWHKNRITVDKEHYCTALTQSIMSGFYSTIFLTPRKGRSILACCVGSELHEMGPRMLCDIFEMAGWDSIYLGAAVPADAVLNSVKEHKPDLLALSVTMPRHLDDCVDIITVVKADMETCGTKIAIGGRGFMGIEEPVRIFNADIYTTDAVKLADWAASAF